MGCAICDRLRLGDFMHSADRAVAMRDGFPVSPGHTLVVPRRHVEDLFEMDEAEWLDVWSVVRVVRGLLSAQARPQGFTVGVNAGAAAGQTVPHAHVHVIPRFAGDVPDPRGGVRWVIPSRARYWEGGA